MELDAIKESRTLVELMIRALVDLPEKVKVNSVNGSQSVIFEVEVDPVDIRRVIGRHGRTADALRELILNLGGKVGMRFMMEIIEPAR